ncbi:MAG: Tn3 family transposase [Desulfomonile sp.]
MRPQVSEDDLIAHFTLDLEEQEIVRRIRRENLRLGFAVLLKTFLFLGYPPRRKSDVPGVVIDRMSDQIGLFPDLFKEYPWRDRLWHLHLSIIRDHTGFRHLESKDYSDLSEWLEIHSNLFPSPKELLTAAVQRCRDRRLELPHEKELRRLVQSARKKFFQDLYQGVSSLMDPHIRNQIEACLEPSETGSTLYDWMKSPPGQLGMKTILEEVRKLRFIKGFNIDVSRYFPATSSKVLQVLRDRARVEDAYQMRRHPLAVRITLMAAFLQARQAEVTDHIVRIFLELIRRIEKKADRTLEKEISGNIRKIFGKNQILYRIADIVTNNPDGTVREVLFPEIGEEVFHRLVEESRQGEASYEVVRSQVIRRKYRHSYRRMMKPVLDVLEFRSNNSAYDPLLKGIELVRRYLDTKHTGYPEGEDIPEEILTGHWKELVLGDGPRANKHYFELCVLSKLERTLKCKEVWVEGAYRFRNPDEDLPSDWQRQRIEYYHKQGFPLDAKEFLEPIREKMCLALEDFHRFLGRQRDVYIHHPGGGQRGVFHVPRIQKQTEPLLLGEIKDRVLDRWGILDLLDILVEADRQVNFSKFFQSSGQRHVLCREEVKKRLLLILFSLGTNLGLARIHSAAKPECSYDDLRYFRTRYVTAPAIREAIIAVVNRILEVRNPEIWGLGNACASDGKQLGAWDQNLMTEWNPHYRGRGVMVYWHVETNATCIYSQLKTVSSSEVASMIEGLVRHDTEMRVESNFVDSHGQSEVAFAFCRFLGFNLLPRLKRIKYERFYLPDKGVANLFPRMSGVLSRPIRWDLIEQQYDQMVKHVVAVTEGTGPIDSILRRFNSYNRSNPTYSAFIELGKAEKTIFLCRCLTSPRLRQETQEALNVIENWNSCNEFIYFGRKTEMQTNDPQMQELAVLSLHLLQNALILINTLMLERVLKEDGFLERMAPEDYRALTPLFTSNVNPYGDFFLDLDKPSFLEVA